MPFRIRSLFVVLLLAPTIALPAGAQVRGRVVDAADRPVAGAVVELWLSSRAVAAAAAAETDAQGTFAIGAAAGEGGRMLTVRRMGLHTRTLPLAPGDTVLVVRMTALPVVLQPLAVTAARRPPCPNREDPRARALWERMRGRYWQAGADSVHVFGFLEIRSGTGSREDVVEPAAGTVSAGWATGALIDADPVWMRRSGYATSAAGGAGERTAFWDYRALDQGVLQDFTGVYFGEAHTLSLVPLAAEGMMIAFCPRGRMERTGQIEGTLELAWDTTLRLARWSFRTRPPDEEAGGEASYYAPDPALGNALLARETLFWRKTRPPRVYFEAHAYTGWQRWTRDRPIFYPAQARATGAILQPVP
ncbi:MAG TPA: carboxypeptidase-like regulatory domain-containing protein [Longimicrobium sp.]|nr:carboxypeptidase-like regulatory domain-containing protein [Longimicrobium sp.]